MIAAGRIYGLALRVAMASERGMLSSIKIELPGRDMVSGRVLLNDDADVIAGGSLFAEIQPSQIVLMEAEIAVLYQGADDWPRALDDALNRLEAAVGMPKAPGEDEASP